MPVIKTSRSARLIRWCGLLSITALGGPCDGQVTVTELFAGIRLVHRVQTVPRPLNVNLLEIDPNQPGVSFWVTPSNGASPRESTLRTTSSQLANSRARVAVNASFYFNVTGSNVDNRGLVASAGDVYSPFEADSRPWPVFNIGQDGVAQVLSRTGIGSVGTGVFPAEPLYNAVSGSERILTAGAVTAGSVSFGEPNTLQPRTAAGVKTDGTIVLVTVDGRQSGFSEGVTTTELAELMRSYGVVDAVNLDGGGSTTMAIADPTPRAINSPSDGSERAVATHLVAFASPSVTPHDAYYFADFFGGDPSGFAYPLTRSGSTEGVLPASATAVIEDGTAPHSGWAQRVSILDDPAQGDPQGGPDSGWFVRHISGANASRPENTPRPTTGYVGVWVRTSDAGVKVSLALDNDANTTADRSVAQQVIPDGRWRLYQWGLEDPDAWEAWAFGDGVIDGATFTLDSIQLSGPNRNATVYIDAIAHSAFGPLRSPEALLGDFNQDGAVNAADYTVWRDRLGTRDPLSGNGSETGASAGVVDELDYALWKSSFDFNKPSVANTVPEPTASTVVAILGLLRMDGAPRRRSTCQEAETVKP